MKITNKREFVELARGFNVRCGYSGREGVMYLNGKEEDAGKLIFFVDSGILIDFQIKIDNLC